MYKTNGVKRLISIMAVALVVFALISVNGVFAASGFSDVKGHWAEKDIEELVNRDIVNGHPNGQFKPDDSVTRAEFVVMISKAFPTSNTTNTSYKDVKKDSWYYDAVGMTVDKGIAVGYPDGTFKPSAKITRQEIAVMLDRALQLQGEYTNTTENTFKDSGKVGDFAKVSVERMLSYKLIFGKTKDLFKPRDTATRAESVAMLHRMIVLLEKDVAQPEPTPTPEPEPVKKSFRDMTLAELKEEYGTRIIVERIDGYLPGAGIVSRDLMDKYYEWLHDPVNGHKVPDPVTYMRNTEEELRSLAGHYSTYYPKYEIISYNGLSYVDSVLYSPDRILNFNVLKFLDLSILPSNPKGNGEIGRILVDIHTYSPQYAIYKKEDTTVGSLKQNVYQSNGVWMVDAKSLFSKFGSVGTKDDVTTIKVGTNVLVLSTGSNKAVSNGVTINLATAVQIKDGTVTVPLREVSEKLGLSTRLYEKGIGRIEVANYSLEPDYK